MRPEHSYQKYKHGDRVYYNGQEAIVMGSAWQFYGNSYSFYKYNIYFPETENSVSWINEEELLERQND